MDLSPEDVRHLASIIEATPDFVGICRPDGRLTYVNPAGRRMVGLPLDADITAYFNSDLCPAWVTARTQAEWMPTALRDGTATGEGALVAADGREIPVSFSLHLHRGPDGEIQAISTIARDISIRREREAALQESEQRFRQLAEHLTGVFWMSDPRERRMLYVSPAYESIWGRTCESLYRDPQSFLEAVHPDDRPRVIETLASQVAGESTALEYRIRRADGSERWIWDRGFPVRDEAGRVVRVAGLAEDVTERRLSEEALRQSDERFRSLMEQAPFSIQLLRPDGRTLRVNSAWEELWGARLEDIGDYNILEDPQLESRGVLPLIHRAFAGEVVHIPAIEYDPNVTIPQSSRHEDSRRWVSAVAYPLRDAAGAVREVVLVHEDVTARTRAEHALRESDEQFRLMADAIPQLAWMARPDGHIFWYNRRWYEYTGSTPEQMEGWGWQSVHDPEVLPQVVARWKASLASGEPFDMVFPLRGADGRFRPFLTRVSPQRDETGAIRRWFGTNTDITDQKQAEEASRFLADASSTLAKLVDYESTLQQVASLAVPRFADWCAVDMVEPDGSLRRVAVAHVDPARVQLAHELHRRYPPRPDAPMGAPAVARTGESELVSHISDAQLDAAARSPEHRQIIYELGLRSYMCVPMKTRGRVLGVITFVSTDSGRHGPAQLALAEQLAGRAAVAIENARLYAELREADRRKDEFLATLAHELRNPLAPIRHALEIVKTPGADRGLIDRSRETMERQVEHLGRLVEDLLDVSRVMRGKIELRLERLSLATVVAHAVETARPAMNGSGHELRVSVAPEPLEVDGDPMRLAQVVGNLLTNAAKYTNPGGRIELAVRAEDGHAVLSVRDNGIGIPADLLPRVFDLFVQADHSISRTQGGLGIGLTLVRNLVELHGGRVDATSEGAGRGSEFVVRLPLARSTQPAPSAAPPGGPPQPVVAALPRRRILVVDDNVDAAETLSLLLQLNGHEVRVAHDGPAALEAAREFAPSVLLLDLGMPEMDGYELARLLRSQDATRDAVIVAVTGWGQERDRRRTAEAGFDVHLVKPVDMNALNRLMLHPKLVQPD